MKLRTFDIIATIDENGQGVITMTCKMCMASTCAEDTHGPNLYRKVDSLIVELSRWTQEHVRNCSSGVW